MGRKIVENRRKIPENGLFQGDLRGFEVKIGVSAHLPTFFT